jgi:hypothetical protein
MKWARHFLAPLVLLVALTGCETVSDGGGSSSGRASSSPRVRCMSDPSRDYQSTSSPMFFFLCAESP